MQTHIRCDTCALNDAATRSCRCRHIAPVLFALGTARIRGDSVHSKSASHSKWFDKESSTGFGYRAVITPCVIRGSARTRSIRNTEFGQPARRAPKVLQKYTSNQSATCPRSARIRCRERDPYPDMDWPRGLSQRYEGGYCASVAAPSGVDGLVLAEAFLAGIVCCSGALTT
jgi:hypothetical protein